MTISDDFTMAFMDTCDRLTMLLIHGFPLNSNMWSLQTDDLNNFARLISPDLRGHGQSDAVEGPYTIEMLASDSADLLEHLAVPMPFVVNGMSMGGYVALEMMRTYGEHIGGLILTSTRAGADSEEAKANRNKTIEMVKAQGVGALVEGMLPKMLSPVTLDTQPELVQFVREVMLETSVEGVLGALAAMRDRADMTESLAQIDVPTLIIHGADDQLISVTEAEKMQAAIPNAKLVIIPDAGHIPNLEQPDAYNDAVIDFLEELELSFADDVEE